MIAVLYEQALAQRHALADYDKKEGDDAHESEPAYEDEPENQDLSGACPVGRRVLRDQSGHGRGRRGCKEGVEYRGESLTYLFAYSGARVSRPCHIESDFVPRVLDFGNDNPGIVCERRQQK